MLFIRWLLHAKSTFSAHPISFPKIKKWIYLTTYLTYTGWIQIQIIPDCQDSKWSTDSDLYLQLYLS